MKEKITILGAGHQGLSMAAHLSANNVECALWNRSKKNISHLIDSRVIKCHGLLEGQFLIDKISIHIEEVLGKTIMVTTPSSAHRDIAKLLAPHVDDTYTIILNPGRTFGILDFLSTLKESGCSSLPCVAETQSIIYTCRRESSDSVRIYAFKDNIPISTLNESEMTRVLSALPLCIKDNFVPADSYFETSLGNVGMILHCAPTLMNIGWIENDKENFEYYYDGISYTIASLLERLDLERQNISNELGHPVESIVDWLQRTYGTKGENLYEHLQGNEFYKGIYAPKNVHHRYIEEDIPNGLVPLEDLGLLLGIETPITSSIITFANSVMNCDYRKIGRRYSELKDIEELY